MKDFIVRVIGFITIQALVVAMGTLKLGLVIKLASYPFMNKELSWSTSFHHALVFTVISTAVVALITKSWKE